MGRAPNNLRDSSGTPHNHRLPSWLFGQQAKLTPRLASSGIWGGLVTQDGELEHEINRRGTAAWACVKRYSNELFDRPTAPCRLKVQILEAEVTAALLYGCVTWAPRGDHYRLLRNTNTVLTTDSSCGSLATSEQKEATASYRTAKP